MNTVDLIIGGAYVVGMLGWAWHLEWSKTGWTIGVMWPLVSFLYLCCFWEE